MIYKKSLFLVILSSACFATACLFVDALKALGFDSMQIAMSRCVSGAVSAVLFMAFYDRKKLKINFKQLLLCALLGGAFLSMAYFYYLTMSASTYSTASVLLSMSALPVLVVSVIFFGEKFTLKKLFASIVAVLGCAFVTGAITGMKFNAKGLIFGMTSCASYAAYSIVTKIALKHKTDSLTITTYCFIFAAIFAMIIVNPVNVALQAANSTWYSPLLLVFIGIVTGSLATLLYTLSLKKIPAGIVAATACSEPLISTLLSVVFLGERLTLHSVVGIIMILSAVTVLGREQ